MGRNDARKQGVAAAGDRCVLIATALPAMADTVKVGLILPYPASSRVSRDHDNAVKLWVAQNGDSVGGHQDRDHPPRQTGPNPDT